MSEVTSETFVETFPASKSMLADAVPASAEHVKRLGIFSHQPSACFRPLACPRFASWHFVSALMMLVFDILHKPICASLHRELDLHGNVDAHLRGGR